MIKAVFNIEAPREQVFTVLSDYPSYKAWVPGCEQSTVTSSNGASSDTEIVVNSMKKMTLGLRFEAVPTQVLNFKMISGKDIKAYSGAYRLMDSADGQGTVVVAELEIDAGPMAPKFIVDRMVKKTLDETGASLRKYVKSLPAAAPTVRVVTPVATGRRLRHVIRVMKTAEGHRIWYAGHNFRAE
jgi:ribosome-associated toxin RatA of RatAB toxin-antitoxin module